MPPIYRIVCDACGEQYGRGWGFIMYVADDCGDRIICPHPGEKFTIAHVLELSERERDWMWFGFPWWMKAFRARRVKEIENLVKERVGTLSSCVCCNCCETFELDLVRDERKCPACDSNDVLSVSELKGKRCPACKEGAVVWMDTGIMS